jgi:hypothetical protein
MAFFKTVLNSLSRALDWISGEDEKLRAARARGKSAGDSEVKNLEDSQEEADIRNQEKRFADEYDVWEEIDSYRTTFWFGSKVGRMMSRSRKRGDQLEKELDELDRKRREKEQMKGEGNGEGKE